jgi:hypothetical protein
MLRLSMNAEQIEVRKRDGEQRSIRLAMRRRVVVALAALAAVLVPLAALGASEDWWFLKSGGAPEPTAAPQVVKAGEWAGHAWRLIAYPSATDGLCFSITPTDSGDGGEGGAMGCAPFVGVERTPRSKSPKMTITFLTSSSEQLPAYIAGPVIEDASEVEIRLGSGDVVRVTTFAAPEPLQHVRFYATPLPPGSQANPLSPVGFLKSIAGLDATGTVVACLAPRTAADGTSSLSDCH